MTWVVRRQKFRAFLESGFRVMPAVNDPVTARLAEAVGFEVAMIPGSMAAVGGLGVPDLALITLTELADLVLRVARRTDLPLLIDADHGYGNALNTMRTVQELEIAGAAAITIEDTVLPALFDQDDGTHLISIGEAQGKFRAAVAARTDRELTLFARMNANGLTGGIDELLKRIACYQETGVDALFLSGLRTRGELDAIMKIATVPVVVGLVPPALSDFAYFQQCGVRLHYAGQFAYNAGIEAMHAAFQKQKDGADAAGPATTPLLPMVTEASKYAAWHKTFL